MRVTLFLLLSITLLTLPLSVASSVPIPTGTWVWPLGDDGFNYSTLSNSKHGTTLENTDYGVRNLDLVSNGDVIGGTHTNCFGVGFHRMYHAGVDLYRPFNGDQITIENSTAGAVVKAVHDGHVIYLGSNYPGFVVIMEHTLPNGTFLYSMYAHLETLDVVLNESVSVGQNVGTVMFQPHHGRFREFHPIVVDENGIPIIIDGNYVWDDSHLHFEIRNFSDATGQFPSYPNCPDLVPGLGYTYPSLPDGFGYLDPIEFLGSRVTPPDLEPQFYLPAVHYNGLPCQNGQSLITHPNTNGSFEYPVTDPNPWFEITTHFNPPNTYYYNFVQDDPFLAHSGNHYALLGNQVLGAGRIVDEEMPQSFRLPNNVDTLKWVQYLWLEQTGGSPLDYGTEFGDQFILALKDAKTGHSLISDVIIDYTSEDYLNFVWLEVEITISNAGSLSNRLVSTSYSSLTDGDVIASTMRIDDVSFITYCGGGAAQPEPSGQVPTVDITVVPIE